MGDVTDPTRTDTCLHRQPPPCEYQRDSEKNARQEEALHGPSGAVASSDIAGPLEQSYRERSAAFRAASDTTRVTRTHWHIAIANGLGWGFDGMDGVIFALATPLIIRDFGVTLPEYRSGLQISLLIGIPGHVRLALAGRSLRPP